MIKSLLSTVNPVFVKHKKPVILISDNIAELILLGIKRSKFTIYFNIGSGNYRSISDLNIINRVLESVNKASTLNVNYRNLKKLDTKVYIDFYDDDGKVKKVASKRSFGEVMTSFIEYSNKNKNDEKK